MALEAESQTDEVLVRTLALSLYPFPSRIRTLHTESALCLFVRLVFSLLGTLEQLISAKRRQSPGGIDVAATERLRQMEVNDCKIPWSGDLQPIVDALRLTR